MTLGLQSVKRCVTKFVRETNIIHPGTGPSQSAYHVQITIWVLPCFLWLSIVTPLRSGCFSQNVGGDWL